MSKSSKRKIKEDAPVSWTEIPYAEAKKRSDIQQFFGDKYGDLVRVVQIGGDTKALNGYSMELCGGTHVRRPARSSHFASLERKRSQQEFDGLKRFRRCGAPVGERRGWAPAEEI